jgi:hypothetical protein
VWNVTKPFDERHSAERGVDHALVVTGGFLEATEDAAERFRIVGEAHDDIPAKIGLAVEVRGLLVMGHVAFPGNHRLHAIGLQLVDDRNRAVGFVAGQCVCLNRLLLGVVGDFRRVPEFLEKLRLRGLARTAFGIQRQAFAVADQESFRRKSPAGTAEGVVFGFIGIPPFPPPAARRWARPIGPSTPPWPWSNRSSALNRALSWVKTAASVPSDVQRLKGANSVSRCPSSSGGSRQGAAVRSTRRTPLNASRAGIGGRPIRFGFGNKSTATAHSSSDNPCRTMLAPPYTEGRHRHRRTRKCMLRDM